MFDGAKIQILLFVGKFTHDIFKKYAAKHNLAAKHLIYIRLKESYGHPYPYIGLQTLGRKPIASLHPHRPSAGLGSGRGSLAHDERAGVHLYAVELGAVPAHPCCVSRIAVHLLRNREHHHFRGVINQDIGGIFSNVCKIGRVANKNRHVSHDFFAHGDGATDAEGVADDEGVAAHGGRGGCCPPPCPHNQTAKGVGGEEEQEEEEEEAEIFHADGGGLSFFLGFDVSEDAVHVYADEVFLTAVGEQVGVVLRAVHEEVFGQYSGAGGFAQEVL